MRSSLHTPVCDLLGCDYPVVLAGMGGVSRSGLVSAVTAAGGFGFLGMVRESPELIRAEVAGVRAATGRDFGVNLIPAATDPTLFAAELDACIAERVPVVSLFWDLSVGAIQRLRAAGILVACQVGSVREAVAAEQAGAQILIAQGVEAGGHIRGTTPLAALVSQVVAAVGVPVLAAGGIATGQDLAALRGLGAQGAVIGTAFLATEESYAHTYHKQRIVDAKAGMTVRTDAFHVNWPRGAYVRVLPNSVTGGVWGDPFSGRREAIGKEGERTIWLFSTDSPSRAMTGNLEAMALYAGEGAAQIGAIVPAAERLRAIVAAAEAAIAADAVSARTGGVDAAPVSASPVCYAGEADDRYMGFATADELLAILNELLEAERAGARVTARTAAEAPDAAMAELMKQVYADEARWCGMLLGWVRRLGGTPSGQVGAFYDKAMAIAGIAERAAFINRGQGWVVRKLREILARVRDDSLHADLADMLKAHEENIARVNEKLG
ncbi:MAG: nitronate monooxygenase [Alphaproteobacteria bacterium]|nr:nitronate monooxygenase [Alphaproteobacteria bacterium]